MNKLIKQAFTLIELLVVIAIIGILSGMIVVSMSGVTQKANIAKSQVFANSLRNALMANIIGEWKFDGLSGTPEQEIATTANFVTDTWGSNHGTALGSPTLKTGSNCISGNCLSFNGSTDKVTMGSAIITGTGDFTVSAWIKRDAIGTPDCILGNYGAGNIAGLEFYITGNRLSAYISNGVSSTSNIDTNWHFVVGTRLSGFVSLYIDGKKDGPGGTLASSIAGNNPFVIGNEHDITTEAFIGLIDDVRVYNIAVSVLQIREQYYAGLNSLLNSGNISKEEYLSKINKIAINE
jgi:prepilin-type N-terminal cleavage/methylation domain-containing protein